MLRFTLQNILSLSYKLSTLRLTNIVELTFTEVNLVHFYNNMFIQLLKFEYL